MGKKIVLDFCPPDKRKNLLSFFRSNGFDVLDVEEKMINMSGSTYGLREIITNKSRNELSIWASVISELIVTISNSHNTNQPSLLLSHLVYYRDFTRVFFFSRFTISYSSSY
jgi:hypothetical protein